MRDVNKLLKLDPTNTTLLAQKHELLQQKISDTDNKLKALREADKQAKAQLESGEIGKDKYDALQREISETEQALKELKKTSGSGKRQPGKGIGGNRQSREQDEKRRSGDHAGICGYDWAWRGIGQYGK